MIQGFVGHWEVEAPAGLTDTGKQKAFQRRTIDRLMALANTYAGRTLSELKASVAETYTEGQGVTEESLRLNGPVRSETGFAFEFVGGGRALVFLTAMAGLPYASPGHLIPQAGRSRFFWRNPLYDLPPGWYTFTSRRPAFWHTRRGEDVITEVLNTGAQQFAAAMIAENNRAVVEFVQNDLRSTSKSPRVHVTAGSGIAPQ